MSAAQADCVFCKIVSGAIPCHRLLDNASVLAFLDINPLTDGHSVVIPKAHAERLDQLAPEQAAEIGRVLGDLARRIVASVGAEGYNILQNNGPVAGQVVPHVHFHIIPRRAGDGLGYRWNAKPAQHEKLAALVARVTATT
ncbi:MAG: HIT family protein [Phycisphaerae bacterium]